MSETPVQDNRHLFGRNAGVMSIPALDNPGERCTWRKDLLFVGANGAAHEREEALRYLAPGRIYRSAKVAVQRASSQVELVEFPGVWFNTVLFLDWEPK